MRFEPIFVSREHRYSLCRDLETGRPVFALPVQNQRVEYEEYYDVTEAELEHLLRDELAAKWFAKQCGDRDHDLRLLIRPGTDRGYYS